MKFLKKIYNLFIEHPNDMGESYLVHFIWGLIFSIYLVAAGVICFIHAVFPFLFEDTASSIARWIADTAEDRRRL